MLPNNEHLITVTHSPTDIYIGNQLFISKSAEIIKEKDECVDVHRDMVCTNAKKLFIFN
jgi:hypothetical protein